VVGSSVAEAIAQRRGSALDATRSRADASAAGRRLVGMRTVEAVKGFLFGDAGVGEASGGGARGAKRLSAGVPTVSREAKAPRRGAAARLIH
jgi:hypothetical protein